MTLTLASRVGHVKAQSTFVNAALVAAHGVSGRTGGFRPSDVRFFFLLFTNWIEHDVRRPGQDIDLTQVTRVLSRLSNAGAVARLPRQRGEARGPRYALTQEGLIGLVDALVDARAERPFDEVLFVICFAASYGPAIAARVKGEARPLTPSARVRVAKLLDPQRVLLLARRALGDVLMDVERRAKEAVELDREARAALAAQASPEEIAARLEKLSPYQMHRVRPFADFLTSLPEDVFRFELSEGIALRRALLFEPLAEEIRAQMAILDGLEKKLAARRSTSGA
jgi:hypothetical protein